MNRKYLFLISALGIGTLFSWYTVVTDFIKFYAVQGNLYQVTNCYIPNPVTTACFYGAWAFLAAFIWSIYIYRSALDKQLMLMKRLVWFLVAGTIFAWTNFTILLVRFLNTPVGEPTVGCSGQLTSNPFTTPCFIGSVIFLISLVIGAGTLFTFKVTKKVDGQN